MTNLNSQAFLWLHGVGWNFQSWLKQRTPGLCAPSIQYAAPRSNWAICKNKFVLADSVWKQNSGKPDCESPALGILAGGRQPPQQIYDNVKELFRIFAVLKPVGKSRHMGHYAFDLCFALVLQLSSSGSSVDSLLILFQYALTDKTGPKFKSHRFCGVGLGWWIL